MLPDLTLSWSANDATRPCRSTRHLLQVGSPVTDRLLSLFVPFICASSPIYLRTRGAQHFPSAKWQTDIAWFGSSPIRDGQIHAATTSGYSHPTRYPRPKDRTRTRIPSRPRAGGRCSQAARAYTTPNASGSCSTSSPKQHTALS